MQNNNLVPAQPDSAPYRALDALDYFNYLARLDDAGQVFTKTKPRFAYFIPPIVIQTEGRDGARETEKQFPIAHYLVLDPDAYPHAAQRTKVLRDLFQGYARKAIKQEHVNGVDYRGPDLWTMETKKFDADYAPDPKDPSKFWPRDPENAKRVCLVVDEDIRWHVPWGTFDIEKGGALAIRNSDVAALHQTVSEVKDLLSRNKIDPLNADAAGRARANSLLQSALYAAANDLKTKLDVYGMKPGFLEKHYDPA
ncbi:MAG: hypothetical protein ACXW30_05640 [Micavibrio sp.]